MTDLIRLRQPTSSGAASSQSDHLPLSASQLEGTWHVTHSTLPLWRAKRNVKISYKYLEPTDSPSDQGALSRLDDVVSYQTLTSDKVKTVHGIDTACGPHADDWDWRGTGWMKLVSSHWEVIGYGQSPGEEWAVTYFASTLFTPTGIDIISKSKGGISAETLSGIKASFAKFNDENIRKLALELFEVQIDP